MSWPKSVGPYRLEMKLGTGGMGEVYRAVDERLGRRVALKQLRADKAQNPKARRRFLREAKIAARLNHPTLVQIHDLVTLDGHDWIVMEWLEGPLLAKLLKVGPLEPERALALARDVISGLTAIHEAGILHRDLKGENIIVTASSEPGRSEHARILDFGLAKPSQETASLSSSDELAGTPSAMSPEQAQGHELTDRSDLFSFGTLLYQMCTGQNPFLGAHPLETMARVCHHDPPPILDFAPELPVDLSRLVDRLLSKKPLNRPASAMEVRDALGNLLRVRSDASSPAKKNPTATRARSSFHCSGEERQVSIVCCELIRAQETADANASSGSLDPDSLYEIMSPLQDLTSEAISRYSGFLGDFQGHRLLIYFGYPQAHEDSAERAVLTAIEIVERSAGLITSQAGPLNMRASVHTGPAMISIDTNHHERLILGQTLDLASQLQEAAPPGGVLISAQTQRLTRERFGCQPWPLDALSLTGYRIVDTLPPTQPSDELLLDLSPALTGREREIDLLIDQFQAMQEGNGRVVLLTGAAGSGKTSLLRSLRARLAPASTWYIGQGRPYARSFDLVPIAEIVHQCFDLDVGTDPERKRILLRSALAEADLLEDDLDTILAPLLKISPTELQTLNQRERRSLVEWLPDLLLEIADRRGTEEGILFVIEDLQWVDATTLEVVQRLLGLCAATPLCLLLSARPEFQTPWGHRSHLTQLHLDPLPEPDAMALIDQLDKEDAMTQETRRTILDLAQGIPLFIEELAHQALHDAALVGHTNPEALQGLFNARLDQGTAKELAQIAAHLGETFTYQDLLALKTFDRPTLDHELERLVTAEILTPLAAVADRRYRFSHPLLGLAARESMLTNDRQRLKRALEKTL